MFDIEDVANFERYYQKTCRILLKNIDEIKIFRSFGIDDKASAVETKTKQILKELFRQKSECLDVQKRITFFMNTLSTKDREIASLRYISGKTWEEIAIETNYSRSGIYKKAKEIKEEYDKWYTRKDITE